RGACAAIRPQHAVHILGVSNVWPRLLGGHSLAAHARGPGRTVKDVLRRLIAGELTEDEALAELRLLQLEELGGRARLDLGRLVRRGVPEVVLAPGKSPEDAARLVIAIAIRQGQGLISRMSGEHRAVLDQQAVRNGLDVVAYTSSARVLKRGFKPEAVEARVGILTAGTSDIPVADEARMVIEAAGLDARLEADLGVA